MISGCAPAFTTGSPPSSTDLSPRGMLVPAKVRAISRCMISALVGGNSRRTPSEPTSMRLLTRNLLIASSSPLVGGLIFHHHPFSFSKVWVTSSKIAYFPNFDMKCLQETKLCRIGGGYVVDEVH